MCSKCEELDTAIARYRLLKKKIYDQQTAQVAGRLAAELEAEKRTLHPAQELGRIPRRSLSFGG